MTKNIKSKTKKFLNSLVKSKVLHSYKINNIDGNKANVSIHPIQPTQEIVVEFTIKKQKTKWAEMH